MEKINKELDRLVIVFFITIFILFFIAFFNEKIYIFLGVSAQNFQYILAFTAILLMLISFFKIKSTRKRLQEEFNDVIDKKKKKLIDSNRKLKKINESIKKQLYTDNLTVLPNRKALERDIEHMDNPKLIILDLDSFGHINEYFGKDMGNFILCEVAILLKEFSKQEKLRVYRIGADEFALLENKDLDVDRYEELAINLIDIFKELRISHPDHTSPIEVNATLGFCLDADNMIEKASRALNEAKEQQIGYLCYFKKIDNKDKYGEQIKWSEFISEAINNDRITPYYQPIFNDKKEIVKYECLVRILDEDGEVFPPRLFLEVAKKVKKYTEIEKLVIKKSFIDIENTNHIVSINLLARDMSDSNVSHFIISMLKKYRVANQVVFEILEDENIESMERVMKFINSVRNIGCKIAIDDFGTGYSNFSYLSMLHPDYIKIDGSLIKNLASDKNSYAIVSSIIVFAKKLNIKTIAEFVHNKESYEICKKLGVDEFQGFYLGEPTPKLIA